MLPPIRVGSFICITILSLLQIVSSNQPTQETVSRWTSRQDNGQHRPSCSYNDNNTITHKTICLGSIKNELPVAEPVDELIRVGENFMTAEQLELTDYLFYNKSDGNRLERRPMRVSQLVHATMVLKLVAQSTSEYLINRYDSRDDLPLAAGPQVNQQKCLSDLKNLLERAKSYHEQGINSQDVNFALYADSFAGSPRGLFSNLEVQWLGSYDACRQLQISAGKGKYCIGSFKYKDWTSENFVDEMLSLRMAVCLPESCDSRQYGNKFQLIKQLNDYTGARRLDQSSSMDLSSLYCAPDEGSELGTWWRSRPTLIVVALTGLWIIVLLIATYRDEKLKSRIERKVVTTEMKQSLNLKKTERNSSSLDQLCQSLSVISNTRRLFSCTKQQREQDNNTKIVDLSVLEAIKVLASLYIMSGHVILSAGLLTSNGRQLATSQSVAWTISNLMPALAVNVFFVITGILTSYLMFSKDQLMESFTANPARWLAFILLRYSRIMPMYALVTLFSKHVARYIGDGPLWDYGTSSLAARRNCQQEPWAWTLLFGANFKSPLKHCIPPAWYLANDFQFFLLTPPLLTALYLRPKWGKRLLLTLIGTGYLAGIGSILGANLEDFRPMGKFSPHSFMVYVNFAHDSYTQPQCRIPAYLIGLLLGYKLYEHEKERSRRAHSPTRVNKSLSTDESQHKSDGNWPKAMLDYGHNFSLLVLVAILVTPSISSRIAWPKEPGQAIFAFVLTTFHLVYALAVGIYVLLATTGNGFNWFNENILKLALWRPLSRLGLCVMLVNMEVITYLTQTSRTGQIIDNLYLTSLNLMSFLYSYLFAALAYVLFELPIRACLSRALPNS